METSPEIDKLAAAFVKAHAQFPAMARNQKVRVKTQGGGHYDYSYADLPSILAAITPILHEHGLAITHLAQPDADQAVVIKSLLVHESGQWWASTVRLKGGDTRPQTVGALISYGKRYNVGLLADLASEEDNDAVSAQDGVEGAEIKPKAQIKVSHPDIVVPVEHTPVMKESPAPPPPPKPRGKNCINEKQERLLNYKMNEHGVDREGFKHAFNIEHIADLPWKQMDAALKWISENFGTTTPAPARQSENEDIPF